MGRDDSEQPFLDSSRGSRNGTTRETAHVRVGHVVSSSMPFWVDRRTDETVLLFCCEEDEADVTPLGHSAEVEDGAGGGADAPGGPSLADGWRPFSSLDEFRRLSACRGRHSDEVRPPAACAAVDPQDRLESAPNGWQCPWWSLRRLDIVA